MDYKITVIMGIYNCEDTLEEAIRSLILQTYKKWKLVLCDDCSKDNTYKIAEKYAKEYNNVILIKNRCNKGLNYTLNRCLKYVDTEYTARMDADDVSLPTRLEKEIKFLETHKEYAIVSTNMIYFDAEGEWGQSKALERPEKSDFMRGTPFCHAPCMVRTEAYNAVGQYSVSERLLRVEDYHLWIKMYEKGYRGYNLQEPLYKMRDDRSAALRRKFKYRINEVYVQYLAIKKLNLPIYNSVYLIRPILIGMLPTFIYQYLHRKKIKGV